MKPSLAQLGVAALLGSLSLAACSDAGEGGDDDAADTGGKGGASGTGGASGKGGTSGTSGKGGTSGSSSAGEGNAGESTGGSSSGGTSGSSGSGGTAGSAGGWCSIQSAACVSALADCPEFTACAADAACAGLAEDFIACTCTGEQMGMQGEETAGACRQIHLGAPGTLSGDIVACFDNDTPVPTSCLVGIPAGCNDLQPVDPRIPLTSVAEDAPAPSGGTIVDGTYLLTEFVIFSIGDTQEMGAYATLSVQGGTVQAVSLLVGPNGAGAGHDTWTLEVAGTSLTMSKTCGGGPGGEGIEFDEYDSFDATPTGLTLYSSSAALTFVKQ